MARERKTLAAWRRGPCIWGVIDGPRRRAGQIRGLDRASGDGRQPPAVGFSVCAALVEARGAWDERPVTRRRYQAASDRPRDLYSLQYLRGALPDRCDYA